MYQRLTIVFLFKILFFQPIFAQTIPCDDNMAGDYPCANVDLNAFLSLDDLGGGEGSDIWGWTSPTSGREYALVCAFAGMIFVDVTDAENPWVVAKLATGANIPESFRNEWRDVKVIGNYAYIGTEATGSRLQVFDLTQLDNLTDSGASPSILEEESNFNYDSDRCHNIVANPETGTLLMVGRGSECSGGMIFYDAVTQPTDPPYVNCYPDDGYTHDAVCFTYRGPDVEHLGKEICIGFNEDTYTIMDVTDKSNLIQISRTTYPNVAYAHQGWITDDHRYLIANDERDERVQEFPTRTLIFDLTDLDNPIDHLEYSHTTEATDHNAYVRGSYVYQANYQAGLRILDIEDIANKNVTEAAYFDIFPSGDSPHQLIAAWSVYPYFNSNKILVNGIEQGLFVVEPQLDHFVVEKTGTGVKTGVPAETLMYDLNLLSLGDFAGTVDVTLTGLPVGATYHFTPQNLPASTLQSTTLEVQLPTTNQGGKYSLLLTATAANAPTQKLTLGLIVDAPLALQQFYFSAKANSNQRNELQWETITDEIITTYFIQRSANGTDDWQRVATVPVEATTSTYYWQDETPLINSYYRIVAQTNDGKHYLSETQFVQQWTTARVVNIYPNPATEHLFIQTKTPATEVRIYNALGQLIIIEQLLNQQAKINVKNWQSGTYFLRVGEDMPLSFIKG